MSTVRSLCFHTKLGVGTDASQSVIEIDVNENIVSEKSAAAEQLGIPFQGKESWPSYMFGMFSTFILLKDAEQAVKDVVVGKCNICQINVRGSLVATSNFKRHLDTYHLQEFVQFEDNLDKGRRLTPKINFALATNLQNQLDSCLVDLIVIDNLPLNIIRRPGLRSFALVNSFKLSILKIIIELFFLFTFLKLQTASPNYKIPSIEKVRNKLIPLRYHQVYQAVKAKMLESRTCSIMLDLWSSKKMEGYLGVTASGVGSEYDPFTVLLACKKIEGKHTAAKILEEYEEIVQEFELSSKVFCLFDAFLGFG